MNVRLSMPSKVLLVLCLIAVLISTNWVALSSRHVEHLTLATGDLEGESYILGQAIAQVVRLNNPKLDISVISTSGSDENLEQIENGMADLAIAQADMPGGSAARTVAVLFEDTFQLIARQDSGITQFTDLVGHKIVLQPNSGEFYSFLELATHYGLGINDFELSFATGAEADELFRQKVDLGLIDRQKQIRVQQKALEQLLVEAANALAQEEISQESFRTFNEAYNTARSVLQRCVENTSEDLCDQYIEKLINLENSSQSAFCALLQEVESSLINKEITQESFRTFMDAYQAASKANGLS